MGKLIIICGLAGSGKTTLARELSIKLDLVCFHKDSFKENLYDILKFSTLKDSKKIGEQTVKLIYKIVEEQLANGQSLILEAPFNFEEDYPVFESWRRKFKTEICTVLCSIDHEERKKRFINRPRHHSHHDNDRLMLGDFKADESVYEKIPGKILKVHTDRKVEELAEEVKNYFNL